MARGRVFGNLLDRTDVLVVDVETTGFGPRDEIVEIAVVDTTGALRLAAPVMPRGRIPRRASDIHGLTTAKLQHLNAEPWPTRYPDLHALLEGSLVIGWNVAFDVRMIRQTCEMYDLRPPRIATNDILMLYRAHGPKQTSYSLGHVLKAEGLAVEGDAHRAETDARAVLEILRRRSGRRRR